MGWLALIIGSALGGGSRYFVSSLSAKWWGIQFPYGTFAVNLLGCFLMGIFYVWADEKFRMGHQARMLFIVGFCGSFTTFSTFIMESSHMIRLGSYLKMASTLTGSIFLGLLLFESGIYLTRSLTSG